MYDLVADVARYPQFLPWNSAARIHVAHAHPGGGEVMEADLVISFKVFRETLRQPGHPLARGDDASTPNISTARSATCNPPGRSATGAEGGCEVEFFVDFEFRNAILQGIIGVVFNDAMQRVVRAFERRAAALYGPARADDAMQLQSAHESLQRAAASLPPAPHQQLQRVIHRRPAHLRRARWRRTPPFRPASAAPPRQPEADPPLGLEL